MDLRKQNILFFTRTMKSGGTENVVLQLCEILKPLTNKIVVCSLGGVNVKKLNSMGIVHYQIPDIENKNLKNILHTVIKLLKIIKKENITVIHTHHRMAAFYVSMLRLYKKHIFINTSHNVFNDKKLLTHFSYKHARIIACGKMVKENLINKYKLFEKQVSVIHNSVKQFDNIIIEDKLVRELHEKGYFLVGNVGRLSEQKGMEDFIYAISIIIKSCSDIKFLIIGIGEDEKKLKNLSDSLNLSDYLYFMGYRDDIQNFMAQLDLIVLSSLWEGLPLTPIEAFSVGKTIVATAVDGTVEVVKDKETGLLVESHNIVQLADKIVWMFKHSQEKKMMECQAARCYKKEFSFEKFSVEYINFYKKI